MILKVRTFQDNLVWLLVNPDSFQTLVVDPGDAAPVMDVLKKRKLDLEAILLTHHHADHIGGVRDLLRMKRVPVYGPLVDSIAEVTHPLSDGDEVDFKSIGVLFQIIGLPGHTVGHIAYYGAGLLFCGDVLFSGGCGRVFEGTWAQAYESLKRLARLPEETLVYCAHEYTASNLRFARELQPFCPHLLQYQEKVTQLRKNDLNTVPSTLKIEHHINPFLRCAVPEVSQAAFGHAQCDRADDFAVFSVLRQWKDHFP